eukprot:7380871-Prymnesium_polylepis.2
MIAFVSRSAPQGQTPIRGATMFQLNLAVPTSFALKMRGCHTRVSAVWQCDEAHSRGVAHEHALV